MEKEIASMDMRISPFTLFTSHFAPPSMPLEIDWLHKRESLISMKSKI